MSKKACPFKVSSVFINKKIAENYIKENLCNRPKKTGLISTLAFLMKNGMYIDGVVKLVFGKSGRLLDGQNTLYAIIESNYEGWFVVQTELTDEAIKVIDTGVKRSPVDLLKIYGYTEYVTTIVSSIVKFKALLQGGGSFNARNKVGHTMLSVNTSSFKILEEYESNIKKWNEIARIATSLYDKTVGKIFPQSIIGGFLAYHKTIDNQKAYLFWKEMCNRETSIKFIQEIQTIFHDHKYKKNSKITYEQQKFYINTAFKQFCEGNYEIIVYR